jgi:[protein-PII] uridylyltransferase
MLYFETRLILTGGHAELSRKEKVVAAIAELRGALPEISDEQFAHFTSLHREDYWLRSSKEQQMRHARMIVEARGQDFAMDVAAHSFEGITELSIFVRDRTLRVAMIAGACTSAGANIVGAQIATMRDGHALDTIRLQRQFDRSDDEERRARRIAKTIQELMEGTLKIEDIMRNRPKVKGALKAFSVEPQVVIDNTLSDDLTVIEINCLDRPGLLFDLTSELADLKLDIASAHIATFGEKAVDVFYVTDLASKKLTNMTRQTAIRHRLHDVLTKGALLDA